jgi:hypothetical protein
VAGRDAEVLIIGELRLFMDISNYFWDGFRHAVFGGCFALVFNQLSRQHFRKPEYLVGLVVGSSALFFLPSHITRHSSLIDWFYQFLHYPLPDWDILLLGIDWHRFFVTHSLIIPGVLLVMFLHKPAAYRFGVGLCIGLSSHLVWDALTCSLYTPVVFLNNLLEIRGYWAKGWLILNGLVLFGFTWFVTAKIRITDERNQHNL